MSDKVKEAPWRDFHAKNYGTNFNYMDFAPKFTAELYDAKQWADLFARAQRSIPGGVNSPVRAFRAVGGQPFFVDRARGARVWDVDGHEYIDFVGTWGPAILGHAHPAIHQTRALPVAHGVQGRQHLLGELCEMAQHIAGQIILNPGHMAQAEQDIVQRGGKRDHARPTPSPPKAASRFP
jgi:hypothetical protein